MTQARAMARLTRGTLTSAAARMPIRMLHENMTVSADDMQRLNQRSNLLSSAPLPHLLVSSFDAQMSGTRNRLAC